MEQEHLIIEALMQELNKAKVQNAIFKIICIIESVGIGVILALLIKGVF